MVGTDRLPSCHHIVINRSIYLLLIIIFFLSSSSTYHAYHGYVVSIYLSRESGIQTASMLYDVWCLVILYVLRSLASTIDVVFVLMLSDSDLQCAIEANSSRSKIT